MPDILRPIVARWLTFLGLLACFAQSGAAQSSAQVQVLHIQSAILSETRHAHIALPANYSVARQRYPLTILLDGQVRAFLDVTMAGASYDLTGAVHPVGMPPQIIVAIEQDDRQTDLLRNETNFRRFLLEELLPRIDRQYRTLPYRTLIGHSLGGRFALLSMCRAPGQFAAIIAASPSLPDSVANEVIRCVRQRTAEFPLQQLVLSAGTLEARSLAASDRLLDSLRVGTPSAWRLHRVDATGLEHTGTPLITIPLGLRFVFDAEAWGLSLAQRDSLSKHLGNPGTVLSAAVAQRAQRLGAPIPASADELALVVRSWMAQRDTAQALQSARALTESHPESIDGWMLLHEAYKVSGNASEAHRAMERALSQSNRVLWFDETQKARFQSDLRRMLHDRTRPPTLN
ncbi:MAG: hypothetical protein IBJ03_05840 [Gemmatimonadaceae bacterium]|nr:hypothetical protein [Gemmatimonadaceae bacterium]